jgi:hypothetical protein
MFLFAAGFMCSGDSHQHERDRDKVCKKKSVLVDVTATVIQLMFVRLSYFLNMEYDELYIPPPSTSAKT